MGVGVVGWALGNVYYTVVLWDLDPIPIPSPSDVLWLGYYPIVYVAVAMLLRARIARFHASLWVDGALAALAVGALSAAVVFQSVLASTGGDPIEVATNLAYPLGDLILLGMVDGRRRAHRLEARPHLGRAGRQLHHLRRQRRHLPVGQRRRHLAGGLGLRGGLAGRDAAARLGRLDAARATCARDRSRAGARSSSRRCSRCSA